jgi:pimeloyl-ACP methyl ester carboxylesterase
VPVHIVVGSDDPLTVATTAARTVIDGAGHYPHLTHPEQVDRVLVAARNRFADTVSRA